MVFKNAERVDRYDWEDIPTQEPMVPNKERRKPSTDQRKLRRRMRNSQYSTEMSRDTQQDTVLRSWASRESVDMQNSKYHTTDRPSLLSIRAQQALDFLEGL